MPNNLPSIQGFQPMTWDTGFNPAREYWNQQDAQAQQVARDNQSNISASGYTGYLGSNASEEARMARLAGLNSNLSHNQSPFTESDLSWADSMASMGMTGIDQRLQDLSRARNTGDRIRLQRQQLTDLSRATTSGAVTAQTLNTNVGGPVNVLSVGGTPVTNVGNQGTTPYGDLSRLLSQSGNNNYGALSYGSDWTPNMIQDYWARATLTRR